MYDADLSAFSSLTEDMEESSKRRYSPFPESTTAV
jgi:hypothetical protein